MHSRVANSSLHSSVSTSFVISLNNFDDAKEKLAILKNSCSGCNELKMLQSSLSQKEQKAYQNSTSKNENLDE